jgi:hypothetical protein
MIFQYFCFHNLWVGIRWIAYPAIPDRNKNYFQTFNRNSNDDKGKCN